MRKFNVQVNGVNYEVLVEEVSGNVSASNTVPQFEATPKEEVAPAKPATASVVYNGETIKAPMPGNILDIKTSVGAVVKQGDILLILEAMKMENEIVASKDGKVEQILVTKGASVNTNDILIVIA